jgi:5-methylcytosine-specific restriction endonuclease McrA
MKCLQCSTLLTGFQKKFCSNSCCATYSNLTTPRRAKTSAKWHNCPTCGMQTRNVLYCSNMCKPKLSPQDRAAKNKAMHNEAWQRYMAKRKNQTPSDVDVAALQDFYLKCPSGHEVDHIIPISKGGMHELSNLQYLTISENRKKSNKIL